MPAKDVLDHNFNPATPTTDTEHQAALTVVANAADTADAVLLLDVLGIGGDR